MGSAAEALVSKGRRLTGPEAYFCRLVAFEGKSATQAYRVAYKCQPKSAPELASRAMDRPHIAARIAELRAQADREGAMAMAERRRLLAETARAVPKRAKATHGDRIAAIREDAILAGERRTDGTQINIGVQVTAPVILAALRGLSVAGPMETPTDALDVPVAAVDAELAPEPETRAGTLVGPLGVIVAGSEASAGLLADV